MSNYQKALVNRLHTLVLVSPPRPWVRHRPIAIGGLQALSFSRDSRFLLIVTPSGRGVFDVQSGERVARDYEASGMWLDTQQLTCQGIGPLQGTTLNIAGVFGGGLPLTAHGWHLELVSPRWPDSFVVLSAAPATVYIERGSSNSFKVAPTGGDDAIITHGFSPSGSHFVVATSHTIDLFHRECGAA